MNSEKTQLLESSLDLIREKVKSFDYFKSSLDSRLANIEAKITAITNSSIKQEKQNYSSFDQILAQSQSTDTFIRIVFLTSLKKTDANATANLRRLQTYIEQALQDHQRRFSEIEQKMLSMHSQKQKILRNLSLQLENQNHSILAVQEWIKVDHGKSNSFAIMEQNMKQRFEIYQKSNEMKLSIVDEKIKYFQKLHEAGCSQRKRQQEQKEELNEQIRIIKKQLKKRLQDLQQKILTQKNMKIESLENKISQSLAKMDKKSQVLQDDIKKINQNYEEIDNKMIESFKEIKTTIRQMQSVQKTYLSTNNLEQPPKISNYNQKDPIATPNNQNRFKSQTNQSKKQQSFSKPQINKITDFNEKKQLPPRKNLFSNQSPPQIEPVQRQISGGVRGLLQKSKQKQRQQLSRKPAFPSRQKSSKGLPPVKEDPFAKKKKTENHRGRRQELEEPEEVVYQIDQQGYLMDQQGNYLLNENGEMIRLSPEQIEQYMMEEPEY